MLKKLIGHYNKVNPSVADILRKMSKCLIDGNLDEAKRLNGILNSDHRLTLGVRSGAKWTDARFMVVPVSESRVPDPENFRPIDAENKDVIDLTANLASEGRYTTIPVPGVFGDDGHGIYAPDGEIVGVMKGLERAELYISMAEQTRGNGALAEWSAYFHDRLRNHEDRDRAIKEADAYFAARQAGADSKVRPA